MNAYELADHLDKNKLVGGLLIGDVAVEHMINMLRQQADRIAELEKQSEPYGYVWTSFKDCMETRFTRMYPLEFYKPIDIVPVYTTPQTKPLTDEEIEAEPSYFGLTNDHTWLSVDEKYFKKLKPTHRMKVYTVIEAEVRGEK
jgi:hypothetical protein